MAYKYITQEEKSKAYDEALERAMELQENSNGMILKKWLWKVFPELAEPSDEKTRKALLHLVNSNKELSFGIDNYDGVKWEDIIAWLEKQGEQRANLIDIDAMVLKYSNTREKETNGLPVNCQIRSYRQGINDALNLSSGIEKQGEKDKFSVDEKLYEHIRNTCGCIEEAISCENTKDMKDYIMQANYDAQSALDMLEKQDEYTDKIEPKFHEGDWVVFNNHHDSVYQIEKIENYEYTLRHFLGGSMSLPFSHENMIRAWTLDDAKGGDVLYDGNNACIFRKKMKDDDAIWVDTYCGINSNGTFNVNDEDECWCLACDCVPATKSQRDALFAKMKEAGYEWDEKTHELKKIEPSEMVEALRTEYEKGKADAIAEMKKPADVMDRDSIDDFAYQCAYDLSKDWLYENASWDDVQIACKLGAKWYEAHHKVQWNEEDEKNLQGIIDEIQANKNSAPSYDIPVYEGFLNWLKSLRPQKQWKPSDAQMQALKEACDKYWEPDGLDPLYTLYEQLKKLTE